MISASPYLDITTLYKKVEKSVCKFRSKGSNQPRVEECYVGDLRRGVKKGNLVKKNCGLTQNIAKTRLQRKRAKLVDGWIGGRRSS